MKNFDMKFNNYSTTELISIANDDMAKSKMDRGDLYSLIQELSDQLEDSYYREMEDDEW